MYNRNMKALRWTGVFISSILASYIATRLLPINTENISTITGTPQADVNLYFYKLGVVVLIAALIFAIVYAGRKILKKRLFIFPHIGILGFKTGIKTIIDNSAFDKEYMFNQIKLDVKSCIDLADDIVLLLISGRDRHQDKFEKFVLDTVSKKQEAGFEDISVFLLHPMSKYLEGRSKERQMKFTSYKNEHYAATGRMCKKFPNKVYYYDEYPVWRIFKFGKIMYITRYTRGKSGRESYIFGYVAQSDNDATVDPSNPFSSFLRYIAHLKNHSIMQDDPLSSYVKARLHKDKINNRPLACDCHRCEKDTRNLIIKELGKSKKSFERALKDNSIVRIYKAATEQVFYTKHCNGENLQDLI